MVKKPLPVGVDDFEKLITSDYYFVDKTRMIKELLDKKGDVNLFTRPRRFGKTLGLSMLRYFFEDGRDREGKPVDCHTLFDGLDIMNCGEEYLRHMGQYPVIQMTLKSTKRMDFEKAIGALRYDIAEEFRRHAFLADSELLSEEERAGYVRLMHGKGEHEEYSKALRFLAEYLYRFHGKRVVILIDEYDVPLESAFSSGYYEKMVDFIRSFFEAGLKTNPYLEFAVVTGCLRITKESIFTGMNNLEINSILSSNYDEYFGFTEEEVEQICEYYDLGERYAKLRNWYNGYIFGKTNIYNPWSVIRYVKELCADIDAFPSSYWANTSSNSIVRRLIDVADREVKDEIEHLIAGGTIEKPVHEEITYAEIYDSMDNLWNFMFFTGYFRKERERFEENSDTRYLTMKIPNREVRYIFREKIRGWFDEKVKKRDASALFAAIRGRDVETMKREINDILKTTISYYDFYESFYHGFLAGILYGMGDYVVKSNRESGEGRTDLILRPVSYEEPVYVFEFKIAENFRRLEAKAHEALAQIAEKGYNRELYDAGYDNIVNYGIAFFGKNCLVRTELG